MLGGQDLKLGADTRFPNGRRNFGRHLLSWRQAFNRSFCRHLYDERRPPKTTAYVGAFKEGRATGGRSMTSGGLGVRAVPGHRWESTTRSRSSMRIQAG